MPKSRVSAPLLWLILLLTAGLAACASAPVQEMSDARQALQAARAAGAPEVAGEIMQEAQRLLQEAETSLQTGNYQRARDSALEAKRKAQDARALAIEKNR